MYSLTISNCLKLRDRLDLGDGAETKDKCSFKWLPITYIGLNVPTLYSDAN